MSLQNENYISVKYKSNPFRSTGWSFCPGFSTALHNMIVRDHVFWYMTFILCSKSGKTVLCICFWMSGTTMSNTPGEHKSLWRPPSARVFCPSIGTFHFLSQNESDAIPISIFVLHTSGLYQGHRTPDSPLHDELLQVHSSQFQAGLKMSEFDKARYWFNALMHIMEPAQTKWATLINSVPKKRINLHSWSYCLKIIDITIRDSHSISCLDECIDFFVDVTTIPS